MKTLFLVASLLWALTSCSNASELGLESMESEIESSIESQESIQIIQPVIIEDTSPTPLSESYWIDVSIDEQKIYLYDYDKLVVSGDVVTGFKDISDTPTGKYKVYSMETERTLTGCDEYGNIVYTSYVDYWMPFFGNYGIHDAQWRDEFGGEIYKTNGSHGCVNVEHDIMQKIFYYSDVGTVVNIH